MGRRFGDRWVFRQIDLDLGVGQCLCVLGANGSGKSTLLKVLAGLLEPSEGRVQRPDRNGIGYSAIDLSLYPQLSAGEHMSLFAKFRGMAVPDSAFLDRYGLPGVGAKPIGSFSTGMRARLKLALATFHQPEVLLLDEPSATLDESGQAVTGELVRKQLETGAVVIATNDPSDRRYATHELILGV